MWVLSLLMLFLFLPEQTVSLNECGGNRPFKERLGDVCETGNQDICTFGRLTCASKNNLHCTPDCLLSLADIQRAICVSCQNNGTYSLEERRCLCLDGYTGDLCETEDFCLKMECSAFGRCSSEDRQCLCDEGFSGDRCQINDHCSGPTFIWDGRTCRCRENFDGAQCNKCHADLVCIPDANRTNAYALTRVPNRYLLDKLLDSSLQLMDYEERTAFRPFIDNVDHQCTCSKRSTSADVSLSEEYFDEDDFNGGTRGITISDDGVVIAYIDSVYRHHYEEHANDSVSIYISLLIFVIFVVAVLAVVAFSAFLFFFTNENDGKKKKRYR